MSFHINPTTGKPGECSATVKPCPYGDADSHYTTMEEARDAYEKQMKTKSTWAKIGKLNVAQEKMAISQRFDYKLKELEQDFKKCEKLSLLERNTLEAKIAQKQFELTKAKWESLALIGVYPDLRENPVVRSEIFALETYLKTIPLDFSSAPEHRMVNSRLASLRVKL